VATISLEGIRKVYANGFEAVRGIDLTISEGEFMVLVGPSGCGKTTVLRMVAGLEDISDGTLRIGTRVVNELTPKERDIAMVFQNYALYPHMTVGENIGFALRLRKMSKTQITERVNEAARVLGLSEWVNRKPGQLSGGQRQRVAMGRAIVREPAVFLMDEPLSNLDAKLRVQMRAEVSRIQSRLGVATLYVTHDQVEAMTMGHRVAVMQGGMVQQCDPPQALYDRPNNLFVAAFIGSPSMNCYSATVAEGAESLKIGSQRIVLPGSVRDAHPTLKSYSNREVVIGIRPEHVSVAADAAAGNVLCGDVDLVEGLGSELLVHFNIDAVRVTAEGASEEDEQLTSRGGGIARIDPGSALKAGERVPFALQIGSVHYFDAASGEAIW
jgi:multiple sugar transport system ATP-binding protein